MNVTTHEAMSTPRWLTFRRAIAAAFTASLAVAGLLPLLGATAATAATSVTYTSGPTPTPATAGASSTYTVGFTVSSSGALSAGSGTIQLSGPTGTTFSTTPSNYTVNPNNTGAVAATAVSTANSGATVTITSPIAVPNGATVVVVAVGVTNTTTPSTTYTLGISTSSDTAIVRSAPFTIGSAVTAVTGPSPTSSATGAAAAYTIGFTTSSAGALVGSSGTITLATNFALPTAQGDYFVNGDAITALPVSAAFSGVVNGSQTITVPPILGQLPASTPVTVSIQGVTNPAANAYTINVSTSSDTALVPTSSFVIGSIVTGQAVALSNNTTSATAVTYTVTFTTSATGALTAGVDTITVAAPTGTVLPTTASSYVVGEANNKTTVAATTVNASGSSATITVPTGSNVNNSDVVTLTINGATNASTPSPTNSLKVNTSKDTAPASASYGLQSSTVTVTASNASASTAAVTQTSNYTVTFTPTISIPSGGTVTICAPDGASQFGGGTGPFGTTTANYSIASGGPAVAVAAAPVAVANNTAPCPTTGTLDGDTITVPAALNGGLGVTAGVATTITIANVTNPVNAASYAFQVGTSALPGASYGFAAGSVTINSQPSNTVFFVDANNNVGGLGKYLITFQTPAAMPTGTVTNVIFPPNTTPDATLTNWKVGFGATQAAAVAALVACAAGGTTCNTTPATTAVSGVTLSLTVGSTPAAAGQFVAIQDTASTSTTAGGTTGTNGSMQLNVNTSVDATNAASNFFVANTLTNSSTPSGPSAPSVSTVPASNNGPILKLYDSVASSSGLSGDCNDGVNNECAINTVTITDGDPGGANPFPAADTNYVIGSSSVGWYQARAVVGFNGGAANALTAGAIGAWTVQIALPPALPSLSNGAGYYIYINGYTPSAGSIGSAVNVSVGNTPYAITSSNASPPLTISATASTLAATPTVSLSSSATGTSSTYTVTVQPATALVANTGTITIQAPLGTTLPSAAANYTVGGVAVATGPSLSNGNSTATITTPVAVPTGSGTQVVINNVTNPSVPELAATAGYFLTVNTSLDLIPKQTAPYTVSSGVTSLTGPTPDLNAVTSATPVYTVSFSTSAYGALTAAQFICVAVASGTDFTGAAATINGTAAAVVTVPAAAGNCPASGMSGSNNTIQLSLGAAIAASTPVMISIKTGAGCQPGAAGKCNPQTAGTALSWSVATTADAAPVSGPGYNINTAATITAGSPTLSSNIAQALANYTINFTPGTSLTGGSDSVTLTFPTGTTLPSAASSYLVNNIAASAVTVTGTQVKISLASGGSLNGGTAYNIVVNGITNPNPGTTYAISLSTSKDITTVFSAAYAIGAPAAPIVSAISPATGATAGGNSVTITGQNFNAQATVAFGAINSTTVTFTSATSLTAVSPAQAAGTYDITVTTIGGSSATSAADQFTYSAPVPAVTAVSPATGSTAGGTSVTVTGTGFTAATAVMFGKVGSTSFSVKSDTSIVATSPAGAAGVVDITVTTAGGTSATTSADQFTYAPPAAPTVTALSPTSGPPAGGTTVTVTGTGFSVSAPTVNFGMVAGTKVAVVSDTSLTVISPAGTGTVDVTVSTTAGTSKTSSADQFNFTSCGAPTVTSVVPNKGDSGATVTVNGTNFTSGSTTCITSVMFNSTAATGLKVTSATALTVTAPAGPKGGGVIDVTVSGPGGKSAISTADQFTYPTTTTTTKPPTSTTIAPMAQGYFLATASGQVGAYGTFTGHGDASNLHLAAPIVNVAATPDDGGYWLLGGDGGILTFGNAGFFGSMGGKPLNKPVVGMASTSTGKGYWEVASDGGIFTFGDAGFFGSMGGKPLNAPIVGIVVTSTGKGYWEFSSDGGIFTFGDAGFFGSMGGKPLAQPVVGAIRSSTGKGYLMIAKDGGVFTFGDAPFFGTPVGHLTSPNSVAGIALTTTGKGYWIAGSDGTVYNQGDAQSQKGPALTGVIGIAE